MNLRERAWRLIAVAIILLIHVAVAVILLSRRDPVGANRPAAAIILRSIPVPPAAVSEPLPVAVETEIAAPSFEIAVPPVAGPVSCDLMADVGSVLGSDPVAAADMASVAADPRRAIMLWDGSWLDRREDDPVRRAVGAALRSGRAACLDELQTGPRLIIIPANGTHITVAVGSGVWRWRDLLSSDHISSK